MKKKLVIFFLAIIPIYITYKITYKFEINYLSIGDDLAKGHTPFNNYNYSYTDYVYNYLLDNYKKVNINKDFAKEDLRIKDLIKEIGSDNKVNDNTLSYYIRNADIITLSIGSEDLFSKIRSTNNYNVLKNFSDELINELLTLSNTIMDNSSAQLYIIGYYSPNNTKETKKIIKYIDSKMRLLERDNDFNYVSIYEEFLKKSYYLPSNVNTFPSLEGYNYISNAIIKKIETNSID